MADLELQSARVERILDSPDIHNLWEDAYRCPENRWYFDRAFDHIVRVMDAPPDSLILDAGCGPCDHSRRLVERGFHVVATDLSKAVVAGTRQMLRETGLDRSIYLQRANILHLPFADGQFRYILCWGVLMHIPAVEQAIAELARVTAPGGWIAIDECNMHSVETRLLAMRDKLRGKARDNVFKSPAGLEFWFRYDQDSEPFLARTANVPWLIDEFGRYGFKLRSLVAGQFTELYARTHSKPLQKLFHLTDRIWWVAFRWLPQPAHTNIIILQKE